MKKFIIAVLIMFTVTSCSTVLKSKDDIKNIIVVHDQIASGQASDIIKSATLSDVHVLMVDHASNRYMSFVEKWKQSALHLDSNTPEFAEFLADYTDLVKQYTIVKGIINQNWDKYTLPNQIVLLEYQSKANKLNDSVDALISAKNIYEAGVVAVKLGKVLAGALL